MLRSEKGSTLLDLSTPSPMLLQRFRCLGLCNIPFLFILILTSSVCGHLSSFKRLSMTSVISKLESSTSLCSTATTASSFSSSSSSSSDQTSNNNDNNDNNNQTSSLIYTDEMIRLKSSGKQAFVVKLPPGMDVTLSAKEQEKLSQRENDAKYEGLSDLEIMRLQLQEFLDSME